MRKKKVILFSVQMYWKKSQLKFKVFHSSTPNKSTLQGIISTERKLYKPRALEAGMADCNSSNASDNYWIKVCSGSLTFPSRFIKVYSHDNDSWQWMMEGPCYIWLFCIFWLLARLSWGARINIRICMLFVLMQINFKVLSKLQNIPDSKRIGENFVISPTLQLSVHQINYWTLGWTGKRWNVQSCDRLGNVKSVGKLNLKGSRYIVYQLQGRN